MAFWLQGLKFHNPLVPLISAKNLEEQSSISYVYNAPAQCNAPGKEPAATDILSHVPAQVIDQQHVKRKDNQNKARQKSNCDSWQEARELPFQPVILCGSQTENQTEKLRLCTATCTRETGKTSFSCLTICKAGSGKTTLEIVQNRNSRNRDSYYSTSTSKEQLPLLTVPELHVDPSWPNPGHTSH